MTLQHDMELSESRHTLGHSTPAALTQLLIDIAKLAGGVTLATDGHDRHIITALSPDTDSNRLIELMWRHRSGGLIDFREATGEQRPLSLVLPKTTNPDDDGRRRPLFGESRRQRIAQLEALLGKSTRCEADGYWIDDTGGLVVEPG